MRAFTDLEQSKKLAKILPTESADMNYFNWDKTANKPFISDVHENLVDYTPCWSLATLLGYLNQDWYVNLTHDGICWQCVIDHHDRKERRCSSVLTDEPVDCCVELIIKLKEENLI